MSNPNMEFGPAFGPKHPDDRRSPRREDDGVRKRIDESHTPLPGETDYGDDDDGGDSQNNEQE